MQKNKFLIVGLGNTGEKFSNTRHNIGFMILDFFSQKKNLIFEKKKKAEVLEFLNQDISIFFIKPTTYMNLSGDAVLFWKNKLQLNLENILVVVDDLNLPFSKIRIKENGSSGSHNGLKDIENKLKTQNYPRMRIGIGNNFEKKYQSEYVLEKFSKEEMIILESKFENFIDCINLFIKEGIQKTMNKYNCQK
jgi:PTH1 family peptidyl-tRNA hydrolase